MARHKVKITVMKVVEPETLFGENVPINTENDKSHTICPIMKEGQEFTVTHNVVMPEGFCANAWQDIREYVSVLHFGGTSDPWLAENEMIRRCTDGEARHIQV